MSKLTDPTAPSRSTPESHQRNAEKLKRIPIRVVKSDVITPK
ncbi:MAG: hypothetical protein RL661_670, partial [Pseudomonadota bacterium]